MCDRNRVRIQAVSALASVQDDPMCGTLEQCRSIQGRIEARIRELLPRPRAIPVLGEVVRNADGSIRKMSQYQAEKYCNDQEDYGTHLPSAYELALAMNASGVSYTGQYGYFPIPSGYDNLDAYYDYGSFAADKIVGTPAGGDLTREELTNNYFWTSSVPGFRVLGYIFHGSRGIITNADRNVEAAVRCVKPNSP